ncbi:MAG TPA: LCP family protein, partial [Candidatus Agathobaculum merdavium]|nr:LCP family protein [Candidatus Agathobaculum merdavium]
MKLFGGGGSRSKHTARAKNSPAPRQQAEPMPVPERVAPKPAGKKPTGAHAAKPTRKRPVSQNAVGISANAPKTAAKKGGKVKKTLTKRQKRRRIIVVTVIVLALLLCVAAAAVLFIRPPQANDPTIKDKENGDKIDVNSMLNSGTRIDDVVTFVIGAVDEDETRTDALMVATMDINKKTVNVMNIPRDTMCNNGVSGASRKINAAYAMGGIEQTKKEIERLMGFKPDYYVIVNFDGIAKIVDAIGGVDYEVPFRMQYDDPSQDLHIDLYAGMQHLDGEQTVEFLRWRHNNDYSMQYENGDEGRVENQQKFLKVLAAEVFQLQNITKIPDIADAVFQNVKTDLTAGNLLWMGMQAMQIKNENIQFFTLPGYGAMSYAGSDPYQYSFFFPYYQETLDLVNKYFNPYEEEITTLDIVSGPESGSSGGWSGGVSSDEDTNVWGDTSGSYEDNWSDEGSSTGGDTSGGSDPEGGGSTG